MIFATTQMKTISLESEGDTKSSSIDFNESVRIVLSPWRKHNIGNALTVWLNSQIQSIDVCQESRLIKKLWDLIIRFFKSKLQSLTFEREMVCIGLFLSSYLASIYIVFKIQSIPILSRLRYL
jgi:hypothetical protein